MPSKRPRRNYTEERMATAINDIMKNGLSQYHAAQKYDIPQQSISNRLKGQSALADQIQPHQLLSKTQEALLVSWVLRQESLGYAPSHSQIRACVEALLKQLNNEQTVGRNWVTKFIHRHPEIKIKRGRRQEANRFNAFTPQAVHWYFDIREKEYGWIKPENTVNVDEGGIMSGFGLDSLVVGSADPKRKALLKGPQSRNWTSFIEAITADGRALTPGIIFKGKELQQQWFLKEFGKIADWHYITSPNGWTDDHIAIEWLERVYLPQTRPAEESEARLIILDGHGSHATNQDAWMATCFLNNVYCCYLPAHCSHGLQPLDNGVFNASKAAYRKELQKLTRLTDSAPVDKVNFIRAYAKARELSKFCSLLDVQLMGNSDNKTLHQSSNATEDTSAGSSEKENHIDRMEVIHEYALPPWTSRVPVLVEDLTKAAKAARDVEGIIMTAFSSQKVGMVGMGRIVCDGDRLDEIFAS
ncbi:hypothetical protein HIM_12504 [Hirsutella minnesotensis 3608]|uniref:HTH CENPB-type domain-containing protein n=1 Tax=Hirsutella minnesotensis 3608 TaxID=1043627 RepID=A0A0F7ZHY2_9HYPO|nr:hypothetical protein HIM_12504 [Hirsutella minnesotensis 3608]